MIRTLERKLPGDRVFTSRIASVFAAYAAFGFLTLLGTESFLPPLGAALRSRPGLIVQCLVGAGMLAFALLARSEPAPARTQASHTSAGALALVLLGVSGPRSSSPAI